MKSYSQAGQDLFCYAMTEEKKSGTFLDIGCNHESFHSNTYGLEQEGWTGLMVDIVNGCESRKGTFIQCDVTRPTDRLLFAYSQLPPVVDFLSLDLDDATIPSLAHLPFSTSKFRVACVEHDRYRIGPDVQTALRIFMSEMGYQMVCSDVSVVPPGMTTPQPFEDWFVSPEHINPELIQRYTCDGLEWQEILKR